MNLGKVCSWAAITLGVLLSACSSSPERPDPTPLGAITPGVNLKQVWTAKLGESDALMRVGASGDLIAVASKTGQLQVRQAATGALQWQIQLHQALLTGVGFDGQRAAVVDQDNGLVVAAGGKVLWRVAMQARSFTPPLVAGDRVFVLSAQREVLAFDADNGAKLWSAPFEGEALVLQAPGLLAAYGNNLLVGWGERLVGLQPDAGKPFWSASITLPRGVNEIERLTDVVAGAHAAQGKLCARAFQAAVACADVRSGQRVWSHDSDGASGLTGDDERVLGVDRSGRIQAWGLDDGKSLWTQDGLRYRELTGPVMLGMSFAVGDAQGYVHWLSKTTGKMLNRMPTDGSAIVSTPVLVGNTLIAQTANGSLFAWQPQ